DSKRIVFVLDLLQGTDGKLQIDSINADGSDQKTIIPHKAFEESPRWSPDGKQLLWVSTRDGNPELYVCKSDGSDIKRLTWRPPRSRSGEAVDSISVLSRRRASLRPPR